MVKDMKFVYGELVKLGWGGIWREPLSKTYF